MPKGVYKRKPFTKKHRRNISKKLKSLGLYPQKNKNWRPSYGNKGKGEKLVGDSNPAKRLDVRKKISESKMGENSSQWKGGISSLMNRIRNCFVYRQWRSDVYRRDCYTCILCGIKDGWSKVLKKRILVEVDHYPKKFSDIIKEYKISSLEEAENCAELWDINNGRTLCWECHNLTKKDKKQKLSNFK